MTRPRKAVIIGGGIGGLVTATALRRIGIDAVVCERAPDLARSQAGAGIHIWHNGVRALQALGLADAVQAGGAVVERAEFRSRRDAVLMRWEVGAFGRHIGAPTVGVSRADLHPILLAAQPEGTLRLGRVFSGYSAGPDGVSVSFADGSREEGDLLIGADGIRSGVRAQLRGPTEPRYAGYSVLQAVVDYDMAHERVPLGDFVLHWGPGSRFAYYHVGGERLYWFGVFNAPARASDPEGRRASALARFADWPEPIGAMIGATPEAAITRHDICDLPPTRRWGEGRATLLGDAAHAMTFNVSQGACQTLEDAVVLMRCLERETEIEPALRDYEEQRWRRTCAIQRRARRIGAVGRWESQVACRARDAAMRFAFSRFVLKGHEADMVHEL